MANLLQDTNSRRCPVCRVLGVRLLETSLRIETRKLSTIRLSTVPSSAPGLGNQPCVWEVRLMLVSCDLCIGFCFFDTHTGISLGF